jgi:tryptophan-rich sensory protein
MKHKQIAALIRCFGWIVLSECAGFVGSIFTFSAIPTWYASLVKPVFSPPNWLFGPVWTTLYALMGIAAYRISVRGRSKKFDQQSIRLFLWHLVVNALWSIVFFGLRNIGGGLVVIGALWVMIAVLIARFWKTDRIAAALLLPYIAWVSFASLLNYQLWLLN